MALETARSARFTGANVLVTGASRGLGRAIAAAFGREGARVGIGFRSRDSEAKRTLALVEKSGAEAVLLPFDVRDPVAVADAFASFARDGTLDVLVNAAAVLSDQLAPMLGTRDWDDVIAINLTGTFNCCRVAMGLMLPRKRGAIVNVASIAGMRASPGQANYAASKGGILALTTTLAAELAPRGVRVNAVVPGLFAAGMGQRLDRRIAEERRASVPLRRFGEADELSSAVLFLASEDASYIVGQSLVVDGGLSL